MNKKKLKPLKPESLKFPAAVKIYINEILCPYYKKSWTKCRKLWNTRRMLSFWVSNGSVGVELVKENVSSSHMIVIWRGSLLVIHWLEIPIRFTSTDMFIVFVLIIVLQSVTKWLRLTLVFMWNSALREGSNCYISEVFC